MNIKCHYRSTMKSESNDKGTARKNHGYFIQCHSNPFYGKTKDRQNQNTLLHKLLHIIPEFHFIAVQPLWHWKILWMQTVLFSPHTNVFMLGMPHPHILTLTIFHMFIKTIFHTWITQITNFYSCCTVMRISITCATYRFKWINMCIWD